MKIEFKNFDENLNMIKKSVRKDLRKQYFINKINRILKYFNYEISIIQIIDIDELSNIYLIKNNEIVLKGMMDNIHFEYKILKIKR